MGYRATESAGTTIYQTTGDTLIKDKIYKILGYNDWYYGNIISGFLREDTVERKVYLMPNSIRDTFEIVYFDFTLNENDSILLYSINYDSLGYFRVDSVRVITTLEGLRKAIYLNDPITVHDHPAPVWVEGIGTLGAIECREVPPLPWNELNCFFKDGVKIYQSEFSKSFDTCIIEWGGVDDPESRSDIIVYPNPAISETNIKVLNDLPFTVYIFDLYGRLLFEAKNQTKIDLNNLNSGTYLIKVIVQKDIYTEKLMIIR
jgi:hypothetical protein